MSSRSLRITYTGDASGVLGAIKQIETASLGLGDKMRVAGQKLSSVGRSMTVGLTLPLVGIGVAAVKTAADFEKTMNTMGAVAGVPVPALEKLRKLAIDLGAKTAFSANEAAEGMLELSKAGITTADIMGGALENSLNLATAGELELKDAATVTANAMNVFSLKGKQSAQAADALAGAANASSADVSDLTLALSQGGLAAANAGLSIQETTAALAAFADAGLRGSDAGTSLKTFLLNLVPTSIRAREAMNELDLSFVDAHGNIMNLTGIAAELQEGLKGLTQAEEQAALKIIFGTDAFRAATIVANEGAAGLREYIKATSDSGTASEVAAAKMKGLPGALETLRGAAETAALALGDALAPIVKDVAAFLTNLANKFTALSPATQETIVKFGLFVAAAGPVLFIVGKLTSAIGGVVSVIGKMGFLLTPGGAFLVGLALMAAGFVQAELDARNNEKTLNTWADAIIRGTHDLDDYTAAVKRANVADFAREQALGAANEIQQKVNDSLFTAAARYVLAGGQVAKFSGELTANTDITQKQRTTLVNALGTLDEFGITLNETAEATLRTYLKTGDYVGALALLKNALQPAIGAMKNMLTYTERTAEASADAAQRVNGLADAFNRLGRSGGGGPSVSPGPIPGGQLQHGGIVTRPTLALIGEAGPEAVIPLSKGSGGGGGIGVGPTVIIQGGIYVGPGGFAELADILKREFIRDGNRNGDIFGGRA